MKGQVQRFIPDLAVMLSTRKASTNRGFAAMSAKRTPLAPEPPGMTESGVPRCGPLAWFGALTPASTPQEEIVTINAASHQTAESRERGERGDAPGVALEPQSPPRALGRFASETPGWARAIRAPGVERE
jgi:tripartite-type tricarboxylate transporter receptor subunit TctC